MEARVKLTHHLNFGYPNLCNVVLYLFGETSLGRTARGGGRGGRGLHAVQGTGLGQVASVPSSALSSN